MRLAMAQHYRGFIWPREEGGTAYNLTLAALSYRCVLIRLPHALVERRLVILMLVLHALMLTRDKSSDTAGSRRASQGSTWAPRCLTELNLILSNAGPRRSCSTKAGALHRTLP